MRSLLSHEQFYQRSRMKNNKGAALISVLALMSTLALIFSVISSDSQVEYMQARTNLNTLKARYLAQSGVEISLMKILIYKKLKEQTKQAKLPENTLRFYFDMIWSLPTGWPLPENENLLESEKKELKNLQASSFLQGSYYVNVQPTDGKIDINDLASLHPGLQNFSFNTLNSLDTVLDENANLSDKDNSWIKNTIDWLDEDKEKIDGGSEDGPDFEFRDMPNRSMAFREELKTVPDLSYKKYLSLLPFITTYGSKGININYTSREVLRALGFTLEQAEEIYQRIDIKSEFYQPFSDEGALCSFLGEGQNLCESPFFQFNTPHHFRINALAVYKGKQSRLETLAFDANESITFYRDQMKKLEENLDNKEKSQKNKKKTKKTRSKEVNHPFTLMYWKEE